MSDRIDHLAIDEREYRRFVELSRLYPDARLVPSRRVDAVWHADVGPDVPPHRAHAAGAPTDGTGWARTLELYRERFGPPPAGVWSAAAECEVDEPPPEDDAPE